MAKLSQTCPYCRESTLESDLVECPACHTPHHRDCWEENGGCTVFGCEHAPVDEPRIAVSPLELGGASAAASYFVAHNGVQLGPYSLAALHAEMSRGSVSREDLVWTAGMPDWVPLTQFGSASPGNQLASQGSPWSELVSLKSPWSEGHDSCAGKPHFGRGLYFLSLVAAAFLMAALSNSRETLLVGQLLFLCIMIPVSVFRTIDVGMSGWYVLLLFVPFANLFLGFRLLLAPRGYAFTRKADTTLTVLTWVFLGVFALILLVVAIETVGRRY